MRNIFIGMMWVFLNFHLDLGDMRIGLIPSFIGYYFIIRGLGELADFSPHFRNSISFVRIAFGYSIFVYILDLIGAIPPDTLIAIILGAISMILSFVMSYKVVMGIKDIEAEQHRVLNSTKLLSALKILIIFSFTSIFLSFDPLLVIIGVIAYFIIVIYYLYQFSKTKNIYLS